MHEWDIDVIPQELIQDSSVHSMPLKYLSYANCSDVAHSYWKGSKLAEDFRQFSDFFFKVYTRFFERFSSFSKKNISKDIQSPDYVRQFSEN